MGGKKGIFMGCQRIQTMSSLRSLIRSSLLIAASLAAAQPAQAGLTVSALRGGSAVDLGIVRSGTPVASEEVSLTIDGTAAQYRLRHSTVVALTSESGAYLPAAALTVEVTQAEFARVSFSGMLIVGETPFDLITSDASGTGGTLRLVYTANAEGVAAGTYLGSFSYALESLDGSQVDVETVSVRLVIDPSAVFGRLPGSPAAVRFMEAGHGEALTSEPIQIGWSINSQGSMRIVHEVAQPLINERGEEFPLPAIALSATSAERGAFSSERALEPRLVLVPQESQFSGGGVLELHYRAMVPDAQRAGRYEGLFRVSLENPGVGSEDVPLPVEIVIEPSIKMSVRTTKGAGLSFGNLEGGRPTEMMTVTIVVQNNTGERYAVLEQLSDPLTSEEGRKLPESTMKHAVGLASSGSIAIAGGTPVTTSPQVVYQSGVDGEPVELSLGYQLEASSDDPAGTYQSSLLFSLTAQ